MGEFVVDPRKPQWALGLTAEQLLFSQEIQEVIDQYSMIRQVHSSDIWDAVAFAFLEHFLRVSTPPQEQEVMLDQMNHVLRLKMQGMVQQQQRLAQEALHDLETWISMDELQDLRNLQMVVQLYSWQGDKVIYNEFSPSDGFLPKCVILSFLQEVFILYNIQLCTLDGYDTHSGNKVYPYLTNELIEVLAISAYSNGQDQIDEEDYREYVAQIQGNQIPQQKIRQRSKKIKLPHQTLKPQKRQLLQSEHPGKSDQFQHVFNVQQDFNQLQGSSQSSSIQKRRDTYQMVVRTPGRHRKIARPHSDKYSQDEKTWEVWEQRSSNKHSEREQCLVLEDCNLL